MPEDKVIIEFPQTIEFGEDKYHPAYKARAENVSYWLEIYRGDASAKDYLTRFAKETDGGYANRKKDTAFPRISARALGVYTNHVFANPANRDNVPEKLQDMVTNFDGDGTDAQTFLSDFHRSTVMPAGMGLLLVTKPISTRPVANREQELAMGLRPMVVPFTPLDLLKWDFDDTGALSYIVLRDSYRVSGGWSAPHEEYNLLRVWTKDAWALYHQEKARMDSAGKLVSLGSTYKLLSQGQHPCGEVPLVPIYNMRRSKLLGETEMGSLGLADANLDIYSKLTWLDQGLKYQGFPILFLKLNDEEIDTIAVGPGMGIKTADPNAEAQILETTGKALGLLKEVVIERTMQFLDTAFRQMSPTKSAGGQEAAEKKRLDMAQLISATKNKADNVQEAENNVYRLAALWEGFTIPEPEKSAIYDVDVDPEKFQASVEEINKLYLSNLLDAETAFEIIRNNGQVPESLDWKTVDARRSQEEMRFKEEPGQRSPKQE